ncbi:MAG: YicC family protein, partial [Bacteroidia bacterium]
YFEADLRIPKMLNEWDPILRIMLNDRLERGTFSCHIKLESKEANTEGALEANAALAKQYLAVLQNLGRELGTPLQDPLREIIRYPDVLRQPEREPDDQLNDLVKNCVSRAINALDAFRCSEGAATGQKLAELIASIEQDLAAVEREEDPRKQGLRERIYHNLHEHVRQNGIDDARFEQEVLVYLDKWDIAEEKQRLGQHLTYFKTCLKEEPKGRKLNFISQEMGREMNTMGVKSNHFPMQQAVVAMKEKLEQIKEQVLNIV